LINSTPTLITSLFLFFGIFSFAGAYLLLSTYKNYNQSYISIWAIGCFLIGVATVFLSLKGILPNFATFMLGNGFNIAAYVFFYYSYQNLVGKQIYLKWIALKALIAALFFLAALILVGEYFDVKYQPAIVAIGGLVFNFTVFLPALKIYKQLQIQVALGLLITFFLSGLVWVVRFIMILFYGLGFVYEGGLTNAITFILLCIFGILRFMFFTSLAGTIEWGKKEELITENHLIKMELANKNLAQSELQLLASLSALAMARDNETGNHIIRTQNYVKVLALRLQADGYYVDRLSDHAIELLFNAAPLHDIGKIGIPDLILLKQGPLTDEEWTIMKTHTLIGESELSTLEIKRDDESGVVAKAILIAGAHHEKWDGSGYPRGLAGEAIPIEARIMSVADMYDALVSKRIYKNAWTHEQAIQEIVSKGNTYFDPVIVNAFIAEQNSFKEISRNYQDS